MHNLKTHSTVSKSFRYLFAFSCNHINKIKRRENNYFFDWTIFLRNYFSKPMKFEYYLLQLKLFQMRPIIIFYGKPFFRFLTNSSLKHSTKNSSHTVMKDPV